MYYEPNELRQVIKRQRSGNQYIERYREYWTPIQDETLRSMFAEGYGISEIACHMNRTERSVIQRLEKNKLFPTINKKRTPATTHHTCLCKKCEHYQICGIRRNTEDNL